MNSKFIIVNEFYPDDDADYPVVEIMGGHYYDYMDDALNALHRYATDWGIETFQLDIQFSTGDGNTYFIEELTEGE